MVSSRLSPYCTASHPPTTDQALSRAVAVLEKLPIPGKRREMMPDVPALSVEERGIDERDAGGRRVVSALPV